MKKKDLQEYLEPVCEYYTKENVKILSDVCLCLGFLSVIASIVAWLTAPRDNRAAGERFSIFVGLWVPSFFLLSTRLSRKADELDR